tara:strand:- start:989 stop:1282 length:294 start_codon:yes stop_codon:yes gene_type:complete
MQAVTKAKRNDLDYQRLVEIMEKSFDYPEGILESQKAAYREWPEYDFICGVKDILAGEPEVVEIELELKPNEYFRRNEMEVRRLLKSLTTQEKSQWI